MKKAIAILLSVILCISAFAGCQSKTSSDSTPNKIALTKNNVSDYLIFYTKIENLEFETIISPYVRGSAEGIVRVSAKRNIEFEDVEITLKLTTNDDGWKDQEIEERIVQVDYNGVGEACFSLKCSGEKINSNPEYKVEIITVSGSVITK